MHKHAALVVMTVLIACLLLTPGSLKAGIAGSAHDFSGNGWAHNEICLPCHTPHSADLSVPPPLWNHQMTAATYVVYDSSTLSQEPEQPGMASTLCLSCHDGTVALDSYGGATGSVIIEGSALIGTNLRDDHPVGVSIMASGISEDCRNCHGDFWGDPLLNPSGFGDTGLTSPTPFFSGKVECLSCHEPHNGGPDPADGMMRIGMQNSELCLHCHQK